MPGKKMIPTMGVVLGLNNTEEKWNSKSKYCSTKHFYNWRSLAIWPIFFKTLEIRNRASLGQDLHWALAEEMNGRRNVLGCQKYCMSQSRWLLLGLTLRPHGLQQARLYHLLELAQTHVHWVSDAIQSSHPLSPTSPLAVNLAQHQGIFQWVSSFHQVAKVLKLQLQHQSFQWIFRADFL